MVEQRDGSLLRHVVPFPTVERQLWIRVRHVVDRRGPGHQVCWHGEDPWPRDLRWCSPVAPLRHVWRWVVYDLGPSLGDEVAVDVDVGSLQPVEAHQWRVILAGGEPCLEVARHAGVDRELLAACVSTREAAQDATDFASLVV